MSYIRVCQNCGTAHEETVMILSGQHAGSFCSQRCRQEYTRKKAAKTASADIDELMEKLTGHPDPVE